MTKGLGLALIISIAFQFIQVYFTSMSQIETKIYKTKCDSLQYVIDSLHAENYPCQIELNRYETAYEIFLKRNPKCASQYGDIISNETE